MPGAMFGQQMSINEPLHLFVVGLLDTLFSCACQKSSWFDVRIEFYCFSFCRRLKSFERERSNQLKSTSIAKHMSEVQSAWTRMS